MKLWPSPAKINLFLHITGQREDGYHNLQTVFQFLDYCDYLQFSITAAPLIKLRKPLANVPDEDNLIIRAAKALQTHCHIEQGVEINIDKNLPMGGGLGGGSSNAATTLIALNELWKCHLSLDELAGLGLGLGADVPVFIYGFASWAEGVGEKITPIYPPEPWYIIISPNCHVSTAEVFSYPELTRDSRSITIPRFLSGEGSNVCEDSVMNRYPPVTDAFNWLSHYAKPRMTGTGACIFAAFDSENKAKEVMKKVPPQWQSFVSKSCNISPLTQFLLNKETQD